MVFKLLRFAADEAARKKLHFLTAAIPHNSPELEIFTAAGYTRVTRECVRGYRPAETIRPGNSDDIHWRRFRSADGLAVNQLQSRLLKPKAKLFSTPPSDNPPDFVLEASGELAGYAHSLVSLQKAYITPCIDPGRADAEWALDLLIHSHFRMQKEFFLCQIEGQTLNEGKLSGVFSDLTIEQAVLVKQLAVRLHDPLLNLDPASNAKSTDTILPVSEFRAGGDNI